MAAYLGKTHAELLNKTDPWERAYWMAMQNIDGPIGEWRNDFRAAIGSVDPSNALPQWDREVRERRDEVEMEALRLQKAQRQLRGLD